MLFATASSSISAALLAALLPVVSAQTYTACSPLNQTCPADKGLAQSTYTIDFSSQDFTNWSPSSTDLITRGSNGAEFKITADGQDPTLTSNFYIFFGRVDVTMKAAPGVGIVSAAVLESDDLDEIDWEFLGGDTAQGQSDFFGKGNVSTYNRGAYHSVTTPQSTFHTYSIDWTSDRIQWLIDNIVVRELPYASPLASGGDTYPQTPAQVKLGNWVAGGASNQPGTVQWAGGKTDFSQAPFIMYVKSVAITNYNPAASYSYGDRSGKWQSIQKSGAVSGSSSPVSSSSSSSSSVVTTSTTVSLSSSTTSQSSLTTLTSQSMVMQNKPASDSVTSSATSLTTTTAASSSAISTTSSVTGTPSTSSGMVTSSKTSSSASATTSGPVAQTGNSAASVRISTAGSLLGLAAAVFML